MNTTTYNDGTTRSEIFMSKTAAMADARVKLRSGDVRAVETTKLTDLPHDYPCPCRSGMRYGRCCKGKAVPASA